ncbi:DHH family phosphoesterase [uncultured Prevotella sp.]|uniref:DHH family phosphoesterase n=1 Tax=uncultured Prevotella sp. TaxID=159272 RepID=UPI0025DD9C5A|nr:DHH family phosphoesterase [uncultured Prevotella sp.]
MLENILTEQACEQLRTLVLHAETILCVCHRSPDGDAIGSVLGWSACLRLMGKEPQMIVPDQYPDFLQWLPDTEKIIRYDKHREGCDWTIQHADLIFCLDFNTISRTGDMTEALQKSTAKKVLIDHHLDPDVDAVLSISRPKASSTCELVFRLAWQLGLFPQADKHFAVPVYCGMMTDTGGFTFNSTDPDIFFIIGQLLTKHINKDKIYRNVYHNYSENRIRLMGYVMYEKLVYDAPRHAAYFTLSRDDLKRFHFIKGDAEGLVNIPQQIKGLKLSISLREDTEKENLVWVSLRSVDDFPCNEVAARFFNGGGHLNASGGRLECSLDEAVRITQQAIAAFEDQLK